MGSIQGSSMMMERYGKPERFSFFSKGALTHHPERTVVFPSETVRSARRMRLLREPYGQCHIPFGLLPLSTQSARNFQFGSPFYGRTIRPPILPPACEKLPVADFRR